MNYWFLNPDFAHGPAATLFAGLEQVFSLEGEPITHDLISRVLRVSVDGRRYYVKRYTGSGKGKSAIRLWFGLRRWFGLQRVRAEWQNLQTFRTWGIPTATLVAYGLERRLGRFTRGALITEEIRDTLNLAEMAHAGDPRLRDRQWLAQVLRQVATITRTLHDAGFAHNDLKWRNLLVDGAAVPTVYLIDCPSGGFYRGAVLGYRIIKDLACLDKLAKTQLSRSQRLRFYLDYAQQQRLTATDRRRIRRIVGFFAGRD